MTIAALCASHTPLKDYMSPGDEVASEVNVCMSSIQQWVEAFAPELVVVLGPDHFNGFFYNVMPSFCIGAMAEGVGDWQTSKGTYPTDPELAEACVRHCHQSDIDVALSYQMRVDHGGVQILDQLFEWENLPAILPIFINCAAPPVPPLRRVLAFGTALGAFLSGLDRRVLVIGSGGISHDPPIPQLHNAPPEVRARLIEGGVLAPEARAARQQRVIDDAGRQQQGTSERTPLNPAWDRRFLEQLSAGDYGKICQMDDASITRDGGCGGHEIRSWIAASAAARAAGVNNSTLHYYRAIPQWIAGYAVMTFE
ncbi:MAG: 2,3-dihydroxyphenylpropionate 1,2-dioxygenase [Gammaproteobacteria bacterium]|jgi:2,3-dihydroxyphenylpropionate 1,2-dioxygenase